jgi:hypothetical protein
MGTALVIVKKRLSLASRKGLRVPPPVGGIDVNFCKSVRCVNFMVPPSPTLRHRKHGAARIPGDYKLASSSVRVPKLECVFCKELSPLRSNLAVAEELERQSRYLVPDPKRDPSCRNSKCSLFNVPLSTAGDEYVHFGKTPARTPRYRCKLCRSTFTGKGRAWVAASNAAEEPRHLHSDLQQNRDFAHPRGHGDRVRYVLQQTPSAFTMNARRSPDLSTDRQTYIVNWLEPDGHREVVCLFPCFDPFPTDS